MKTKASTARKIPARASNVWAAVSKIGRLDVWFPSIEACRVEGDGIGARRFIRLANAGGDMEDHIVEIDHAKRRLVYNRTRHPFPVSSYIGTVEVLESFDGLAVVTWTVDFESTPENGIPLKHIFETGIGNALKGMEDDLKESL